MYTRIINEHFLTQKQSDVLSALVNGLTRKEIARNSGVCIQTVDGHINRLKVLFNVNRPALIVSAAVADNVISIRRASSD